MLVGLPSTGSKRPGIEPALSLSIRIGAEGAVASPIVSSGGSGSYCTSISATASSARCGSVAQSAATGWPRCSTVSDAMRRSMCQRSGTGPR